MIHEKALFDAKNDNESDGKDLHLHDIMKNGSLKNSRERFLSLNILKNVQSYYSRAKREHHPLPKPHCLIKIFMSNQNNQIWKRERGRTFKRISEDNRDNR